MANKERVLKQITYLVIFLVILGGIVFLIFNLGSKVGTQPTPSPLALKPIEISFVKILRAGNFDYDVISKITNPNSLFGSPEIKYKLSFEDKDGAVFETVENTAYILPGQTRYVIDTPIVLSQEAVLARMQIISVDWVELDRDYINEISFISENKNLVFGGLVGAFAAVKGSFVNFSDFDFAQVDVISVLFDSNNEIKAVGKTNIRTFLSSEKRDFEVFWFSPFEGKIDKIDAEAHTNVFDNINFIRRFGGEEMFQQF